jgi:hypothetical protein
LVYSLWNYGPDPNDWHAACFPYDSYLARVLREGSPRKIFILQRVLRWIYVGTFLKLPELRLFVAEMCDFLSIYHRIETTFEFMHYTVEGYLSMIASEDKQLFKLDDHVVDSELLIIWR